MANYVVEEKDRPKKTFFNLSKITGLKPLLIILALLIVAIIFFSSGNILTTAKTKETDSSGYLTSMEYINRIEAKLAEVVSNIKGAGQVKVMISIDSSPVLEVAENTEEKTVTSSGGTTVTVKTEPIIVDVKGEDAPLVLKETLPTINGVIVVSSGASNTKVKLDIITAVTTALGINSNIVEVFAGV